MEKLRTIAETINELKSYDPGCQLTDWALRQMVKEGKIPYLKVGKKALLSVEAVERYVDNQLGSESSQQDGLVKTEVTGGKGI